MNSDRIDETFVINVQGSHSKPPSIPRTYTYQNTMEYSYSLVATVDVVIVFLVALVGIIDPQHALCPLLGKHRCCDLVQTYCSEMGVIEYTYLSDAFLQIIQVCM